MNNRIKELRSANDISQETLAKELGVSQGTLSNWERGEHEIDRASLEKLADKFNVSFDYLLNRTNTEEPSHLGDHKKNLDYFGDKPDLLAVYNDIVESDNLRLLFDSAKDLEPKDLETVLKIVKSLKESDD